MRLRSPQGYYSNIKFSITDHIKPFTEKKLHQKCIFIKFQETYSFKDRPIVAVVMIKHQDQQTLVKENEEHRQVHNSLIQIKEN